jgi:MOSC domain-containing protein YiiM
MQNAGVIAGAGAALTIHRLFVSPGHNYFGRHGKSAAQHGILELERVECVAGCGIRGDRFFKFKTGYKGQITFFSEEVFEALQRELALPQAQPSAARRNVFVKGVDLNQLIGVQFELQGVRLEGAEECRPCHWMNSALGPNAEQWLKGRGGLRARILTDGWLRRENGTS